MVCGPLSEYNLWEVSFDKAVRRTILGCRGLSPLRPGEEAEVTAAGLGDRYSQAGKNVNHSRAASTKSVHLGSGGIVKKAEDNPSTEKHESNELGILS